MSTKNDPGKYDCLAKALPDEPIFVLLARDVTAPSIVTEWAKIRAAQVAAGERPLDDLDQILEALDCAKRMVAWRAANHDPWRTGRLPQVRFKGEMYWLCGPNLGGVFKDRSYVLAPLDHFDDNGECIVRPDTPCFAIYDPRIGGVMKQGTNERIGGWDDLEHVG